MIFTTKLLNPFKNISRYFSNVIREEIAVQTFCDIHINIPYNVNVKPLDIHKYHNCDLLRIELQSVKDRRDSVKHVQDGNSIKIFATTEEYDQDTTCNIQAPVKANLNITAQGDIKTGAFGGSKLILKSKKGNIFVDKFQGETIQLDTEKGDIVLKGAIVASDIKVVSNMGSIRTKRIQGLNVLIKSNEGSITIDSSYCDKGTFEVNSGDLNLQNLHKNNKVKVRNGRLNLSGLDGQLEADLQNTQADIQISRILENSTIKMIGQGELKLLLSDTCQDNTLFEIITKDHTLDPSVKLIPSKTDNTVYLMPRSENYKQVRVECDGMVHIQNASWINMLKLVKK